MSLTKYFYLGNLAKITVFRTHIISQFYSFPRKKTLKLISSTELCRNFNISVSFLKKQKGNETPEKENKFTAKKFTEGPQVTVFIDNGPEKVMFYSEVEKFANRNNLNIVKLESTKYEKPKYKLVPVAKIFEDKKKNESKSAKKIFLRDSISDHDLHVKITATLKFLEKGKEVSCVVNAENDPKKMNEVYEKIKNSALGDFIFQNKKSERKIMLLLKPKVSETKESEEKTEQKAAEERKTDSKS